MKLASVNSFFAVNSLARTSRSIARALERLSSGRRVSGPSDDPAAYSLGVRLDSQIRGLHQGTLNANHAVGLMQTADAAISAQLDIARKMREIALRASNSSMSFAERSDLQKVLGDLTAEFNRITNETEFENIHLLDGSFGTRSIQVGPNAGSSYSISLKSTKLTSLATETVGTGVLGNSTSYSTSGGAAANARLNDVNNDGILDLIAVAGDTMVLSVQLGIGNGKFSPARTYSAGNSTFQGGKLSLGDINNDGQMDILLNASADGNLGVFLGNGDGTFRTRTTLAYNASPELADFNGDGNLDFAGADASGNLLVALGNGNGTFQSSVTYAVGSGTESVLIADLNGDGHLDIATGDYSSSQVSLRFGNGNGTFGAISTLSAGNGPQLVLAYDMNNDGILDLVTGSATDQSLNILIGNGNGTYKSKLSISIGTNPESFGIADFNGDGALDVIADSSSGSNLYLLLGNGDGTLKTAVTFAGGTSGFGSNSIAVGDTNGDGVSDVVMADLSGSRVITLTTATREAGIGADLSISTEDSASDLAVVLDQVIEELSKQKTNIAGLVSRLNFTTATNLLLSDSLEDAKSSAIDTDYAVQVAEFVRLQILEQSQTAVLAQANMNLQIVLKLLR